MLSPPMSICGRTPGACSMNATAPLRPLGRTSRVSLVNTVVGAVDTGSTTGEAPVTVTVSASEPTFIGDVDLRHEGRGQHDPFPPRL